MNDIRYSVFIYKGKGEDAFMRMSCESLEEASKCQIMLEKYSVESFAGTALFNETHQYFFSIHKRGYASRKVDYNNYDKTEDLLYRSLHQRKDWPSLHRQS